MTRAMNKAMTRIGFAAWLLTGVLLVCGGSVAAQAPTPVYGPFNVEFPAGGDGYQRTLSDWNGAARARGGWSLFGWVQPSEIAPGRALVGGLGDPAHAGWFLALDAGRPEVWSPGAVLTGGTALSSGGWRFLAAVSDGVSVRLYVDGLKVAEGLAHDGDVQPIVELAPRQVPGAAPFAGRIAGFSLAPRALTDAEVAALAAQRPDPALIVFDTGSPTWPVQKTAWVGLLKPQDAWTLPHSKAPTPAPVAKPAYDGPALQPQGADAWTLPKWRLIEAPKVKADGAALSQAGYDAQAWYPATVPGTVLTTLVDRGVYPDPEYDLNNMAIPESLARQDYWYRTEFTTPVALDGRRPTLTFNGINYAAEVWLNGARLGEIKGAFVRGQFDLTGKLKPGGVNALAVRISPPPHPGIPHEQSILAGAGQNGGMQALDGPTFIATEGWDWIPGVRDRNSGLWQDVVLSASGPLRIGDPHVVTTLPRDAKGEIRTDRAEVEIEVPLDNATGHAVEAQVSAAFDEVTATKTVLVAPGDAVVKFSPAEFPQLTVAHPRLWWPNGYGAPDLHTAHLTVSSGGEVSDRRDVRFGMREITYELSLMDSTGHLRRVEIDPSRARQLGQAITDGRHEGVRKVPGGWAASLTPGAESSGAVHALPETTLSPYLVIRVNGVRIAARGGSWGMDDWMKRVSRARLEPYFRLHRDANINIIRNWVGQDTEEVFYDLADEYGLLITNDFWDSTQDFQLEAQDVPLFLKNAADTISRYRNHPSIAIWFGRNEGMPQPVLNEGLERLVRDLDGTRYYSGSSNRVNLQDSGPYSYREPESYFTKLSKGFAVEVGTPSFPTLEAFEADIAPADRWPINDAWAYHDWHQDGNGDVHSFMAALSDKLGAPKSLEDFERKAQLMNYETYRAVFEGMNAELWTKTSGRMLWMTQPAWPSTHWQVLSHDYDTHAAYYGLKAGSERIHIQLSLPDHRLELVNNGLEALKGVKVRAVVVGLDGARLAERSFTLYARADDVAQGPILDVAGLLAARGAVVVELTATGRDGKALSRNVYWLTRDAAGSRALDAMAAQPVSVSITGSDAPAGERRLTVALTNTGSSPSLNNKLTLLDSAGRRILPAYYSDNYVSLLPGERRTVEIRYPAAAGHGTVRVALRGWNTRPTEASAPDEGRLGQSSGVRATKNDLDLHALARRRVDVHLGRCVLDQRSRNQGRELAFLGPGITGGQAYTVVRDHHLASSCRIGRAV
jgi:hypothetical protein